MPTTVENQNSSENLEALDQISEELLNLKNEIATTIIEKLYNGENLSETKKKNLINYLIDKGTLGDKVGDFFRGMGELLNGTHSHELKFFRELLNNKNNKEDLLSLKNEILSKDETQIHEYIITNDTKEDNNTSNGENQGNKVEQEKAGNSISDAMFQQLLKMEGDQNFKAKTHGSDFGEKFVTGPYGMVYKYDKNGKQIGKFKEGETMTPEAAKQNAKNYYQKSYNEWKSYLSGMPNVTQDRLDALVSASGGTVNSKKRLQKYVKQNRGNWNSIDNFWRDFAVRAAGNNKRMPGLVSRRNFEADWFKGEKNEYRDYQKGGDKYTA